MIVTPIQDWKSHFQSPVWIEVFGFLQELQQDAPECDKIPLSGEIFARIMSYPVRGPEGAILEAHDRFIDVQMSLIEHEWIAWYPRASLTIQTPYDDAADVALFERPGPSLVMVKNVPGIATILFPEDAHMAQLAQGNEAHVVKKVVVKVPVDRALAND